jgi:hypothetical protein
MSSAIANFFANKNSNFDFPLVSDRLNAYSKRELEFGLCKTRARVPEERYGEKLETEL